MSKRPGLLLLVLVAFAAIGLYFLVKNGGSQAPLSVEGLPTGSQPASTALVGEYAPDVPDDPVALKEKYLDLLAANESLEAQNEQLLERVKHLEAAAEGTPEEAEDSSMQAEAAQIRELAYRDSVKVRFVDSEEFQRVVLNQITEKVSHAQADNRFRAWTALGLIPTQPALPGTAILAGMEAEQSGGVFLPSKRELVVPSSDREINSPSVEKRRVAAYARVLQEDLLDPQRLPLYDSSNDDRAMAAWCLQLGDAASVAMRSSLRRHPDGDAQMSAAGITPGRDPYPGAPVSVREWLRFPRSMGHWFVEALWAQGGNDAVNDAYRKPPRTTSEIIHPSYYLNPDSFSLQTPEPPVKPLLEGPAYWDNVLGEAGVLLLLKLHLPDEVALKASDGWRGDRWLVWRSGGAARGDPIWWESRWSDEEDAKEFQEALAAAISRIWEVKARAGEPWTAASSDGMEFRIERKGVSVVLTKRAVGGN